MLNVPAHVKIYFPQGSGTVKGAIQIIHSFFEDRKTYDMFAKYLSSCGYAVIISDLRGHGSNTKSFSDIGYIGDNGAQNLVSDIHDITKMITERFPDKPYFIIGQGIGALIAISYLKKYDYFADGFFFSDIPVKSPSLSIRLKSFILQLFRGDYYRSEKIQKNLFGRQYISEDQYTEHRYTGLKLTNEKMNIYTLNACNTYISLFDHAYRVGSWIKKQTDIPIRIIYDRSNSSIKDKNRTDKVTDLLREQGYDNIQIKLARSGSDNILTDPSCQSICKYIVEEMSHVEKRI